MDGHISLGNLLVDLDGHLVWVGGQRVKLTHLEFRALLLLATRAGFVVPSRELAEALWGPAADERASHLRGLISRLRRKLHGMHPWQIRTVTKRGYGLFPCQDEGR
jgi:DNA-binding response OmpR family regulator